MPAAVEVAVLEARRPVVGAAGEPNELWQMDVVGGFLLADGSQAKALTGVDDHSRFCVSARLMARERTQPVCDGLTAALETWGVPELSCSRFPDSLVLAEQHDEWTEQRRYFGLEILAKSRLQDITCAPTDAQEVTIPAITA